MTDSTSIAMLAIGTSVAAVVGAVVMNLFNRPDDTIIDTTSSTGSTGKKATKKDNKKDKAKPGKKAPAPEPEEEEPEIEQEPETVESEEEAPASTSSSSKKKKKKKAAKAEAAAAAAPAPAPVAAKAQAAPAPAKAQAAPAKAAKNAPAPAAAPAKEVSPVKAAKGAPAAAPAKEVSPTKAAKGAAATAPAAKDAPAKGSKNAPAAAPAVAVASPQTKKNAPTAAPATKAAAPAQGAKAQPPAAQDVKAPVQAAKAQSSGADGGAKSKKDKKKNDSKASGAAAAPIKPEPPVEDDDWEVVATTTPRKVVKQAVEEVDASSGRTTVTLNVAGHKTAIIGAKGAIIQEISAKSGAKIDLGKEDSTCTIAGTAEEVAIAHDMVRRIIREREDFKASQVEEVVPVAGDRIPTIIGKGGSKIKEIQQTSGASVNVDKATNVVTVKGTPIQVAAARELIELVLNPPEIHYETNFQMNLPSLPLGQRTVSIIIGHKGETIRRIENETGAKLNIDDNGLLSIKGSQQSGVAAFQLVSKILSENSNSETVPLKDSRAVGAILGRAGSTIQKVENESKAHLKLETNEDGSKKVVIEGTADQIAKAKVMVTAILEGGPVKPTPGEGEVVEEIRCPANAVGGIIGKGGAEIKALQEKTGAKIDVPRELNVIWVVGKKKDVAAAVATIKEKIAATATAEQERETRKIATAESAARTEAAFAANGGAPSAEDADWGRSLSGSDGW